MDEATYSPSVGGSAKRTLTPNPSSPKNRFPGGDFFCTYSSNFDKIEKSDSIFIAFCNSLTINAVGGVKLSRVLKVLVK